MYIMTPVLKTSRHLLLRNTVWYTFRNQAVCMFRILLQIAQTFKGNVKCKTILHSKSGYFDHYFMYNKKISC